MSGCPGPKDMGGVVRARQTIGPTSSLVAMLPARLEAGGWMVWMEAVAAPGVVAPPDIQVNLDMGRFVQARQFTIPGGGFRVYTVPSNVPVTVRATSRGVTTPATLAAWPVDQVRWANPEFYLRTASGGPGVNFASAGMGAIPSDANRIMVCFRGIATSVASLSVEGQDRNGQPFELGSIQLAANQRSATFEIVPGFFTNISVTSTGVVPFEVLVASGAVYRSAR